MKEQPVVTRVSNISTIALFIIYLIALYWILLLKLGVQFSYMANRKLNLIPFKGTSILNGENILNVVIFIPLGIYAGVLFKGLSTGIKLLLFFIVSLIIEGVQYLFRLGAFDVTDIITNTSGGVIGFIIFKGIEKAFNNHVKAQQIINVVAMIGTVLMISLLVLLKMNMLPVRYQ